MSLEPKDRKLQSHPAVVIDCRESGGGGGGAGE